MRVEASSGSGGSAVTPHTEAWFGNQTSNVGIKGISNDSSGLILATTYGSYSITIAKVCTVYNSATGASYVASVGSRISNPFVMLIDDQS